MRHVFHSALAVSTLPLLASCAFLLDFDKLQSGPTEGDAGAPTLSVGGNGSAGRAGMGDACGDCDDSDPCTLDTCDEAGAVPSCQHQVQPGLALDGFDTTLTANEHGRATLVSGTNAFYLSVLETQLAGQEPIPEVTLYQLDSDAVELETLAKLSNLPLTGLAASSAGLAVDETLGGLTLHAFVAVQPATVAETTRVLHLTHRNGNTTAKIVGTSYSTANPWVSPQALKIGNSVTGAWIQEDGTIAVHGLLGGATTTFGAVTLPATTFALLSTADDQPAVLFTAEAAGSALGTYLETSGRNRSSVIECQRAEGAYLSSTVIGTGIPGVWIGNITKAGADYLTTSGTTIVCGANSCTSKSGACTADDLASGVRNVAGATVRFDADPPGVVYSVAALPQLQAKAEPPDELEAVLNVALTRADFSPNAPDGATGVGEVLELARMDSGESLNFGGPDWPAVAILPTGTVAIAWSQPQPGGVGSELHLQRYKMCLPPP